MKDFLADAMELFGMAYFQDFSDVMYQENMYFVPFLFIIFIPLVVAFFFYKVLDKNKGANSGNWLLHGLAAIFVTVLATFLYVNTKNTKLSLDFLFGDMLAFLLITTIYSIISYFLFSFLVHFLSTHRRKVPAFFP